MWWTTCLESTLPCNGFRFASCWRWSPVCSGWRFTTQARPAFDVVARANREPDRCGGRRRPPLAVTSVATTASPQLVTPCGATRPRATRRPPTRTRRWIVNAAATANPAIKRMMSRRAACRRFGGEIAAEEVRPDHPELVKLPHLQERFRAAVR